MTAETQVITASGWTKRIAGVALAGCVGFVVAPNLGAQWTHGRWFVGMSVLDRLAVSKDAPVVVPFLLIVTALNWRVLRSLLFPALLLWSAIVGAYLGSFVYFDWFATLDTTPLPGLLDGVAGALLILIVCAAVPTVLAIGLAWLQKHSVPRREVG